MIAHSHSLLQLYRKFMLAFILVASLALMFPVDAYADDCLSDPLNAADCMRTPGFRQGITVVLGATATMGVVLTNIVSQSVRSGTGSTTSTGGQSNQPGQTKSSGQSAPPPNDTPRGPTSQSPPQSMPQGSTSPPPPQRIPQEVGNQPPPQRIPPEAGNQPPPQRIPSEMGNQPPPPQDPSLFSFDNFKRLVDYPNKVLQVLSDQKLIPEIPEAVEAWKRASELWHRAPSAASAEEYIKATRDRIDRTGKMGKYLDKAGKVMDAVDAVFKAEDVIKQRGYEGWEKAGAYYVEGANKVIVTVLTKNPIVSIVDQVVGDLTGHNIESTIRAGEEKWHETTKEYFENVYNAQGSEAEITTKDEGLRYIRRIRDMMDKGQLSREEGTRRARRIFDKMLR